MIRFYFWIILFLIVLSSCSSKLSPYFKYNEYLSDHYQHLMNDSLKLHLKTPYDITFLKDKKSINRELRTHHLHSDGILIYGKTTIEPHYAFFILYNNQKTKLKKSNAFCYDTLINNQKYTFIGIPLAKDKNLNESEFKDIIQNLKVGDNYMDDMPRINELNQKFFNSNKFYLALNEFDNFPIYNEDDKHFKFQMQLTYTSFLGANKNYFELLKKRERNNDLDSLTSKIIKDNSINGLDKVKEVIMKEVQNRKIVLFNENHFMPNHRLILLNLLQEFKESGFNYMALEALGKKQDSVLNSGTSISLQTGFYTREQTYSNLVRKAQELGFKFVVYENYDKNKDRELAQAENLYNQTFAKDSLAKVIVLAGISHILENPDSQGKKWMAALFKEKYGIDPLTFNQTSLNHFSKIIDNISIIKSEKFSDQQLNASDWLIINNLKLIEKKENCNFKYKNKFKETVQLALFLDKELDNHKQINNKVPFKSYLLQKGECFYTNIPLGIHKMLIFDKNGNLLKEKVINRK